MGTGDRNTKPELFGGMAIDLEWRRTQAAVVMVEDGPKTRKGCVPFGSVSGMQKAGADFLLCKPSEVQVWALGDPSNPFAAYLLGLAGTPNHTAEFLALALMDAYMVDGPESQRYRLARARVLLFLEWQRDVAMWSVPGGRGLDSEAFGPSHPEWWINAFAAILWHAIRAGDSELLALSYQAWRLMLNFFAATRTAEATVLLAGPRANRLENKDSDDLPSRGRHQSVDDCVALMLDGDSPRLAARRKEGFDLVSLRMLASVPVAHRTINPMSGDLPRTADGFMIGRSGADVAVWIDGRDRNNPIDPGYQEAAQAIGGVESYWTAPSAANGKRFRTSLPGAMASDHPSLRTWQNLAQTRPAGLPTPSWKDAASVIERAEQSGTVHPPVDQQPPSNPRARALAEDLRKLGRDRPALANRLGTMADRAETLRDPD